MTNAPRDAFAQKTWDGGDGQALWNWNNNWNPDGAPTPSTTQDLIFSGGTKLTNTNNLGAFVDFRNITFTNTTGSFVLAGDAIDLFGKIENNDTETQTIQLTLSMANGAREISPVNGNLVINSANVFMGGSSGEIRVWGNNGNTLTMNTVISEAGNLSIQQNSTVIFQRTNTYSGGTFIRAGQLIISNNATAGSGNITMGEVNLIGVSLTNALYLGTSSSGGGLTNTNNITVNSGGGASTIGANNTSGTNAFTGSITLNNGARFNVGSGGTLLLSGAIGGVGGFTNVGSGITLFSGANTYTGPTTVSAGTVRLLAPDRVSDSSAVDVASGATFDLNSNNETVASINGAGNITLGSGQLIAGGNNTSTTFSGIMSGSGNFVKTGTGTLTVSGANTYSGQTFIVNGGMLYTVAPGAASTGIISIGETNGSASATFAVTNGITITNALISRSGSSGTRTIQSLSTSGTNTLSGALAMSNNTTFDSASGGTLRVSGAITNTGQLTKSGAGTLLLTASNSYAGGTVISAGTLAITNGNALGSGQFNMGNLTTLTTLDIQTNATITNVFQIYNVASNAVINVASGATATISGRLTQDGAKNNTTKFGTAGGGTLVLNNASSDYNGQIQIGNGTVILGTNAALGTNNSTSERGIDLGLNVDNSTTSSGVALLASNNVTVGQSIFIADNTGSSTRTIGLSGNGTNTYSNEMFLSGNLTISAGSLATDLVTVSGNIVSNNVAARGIIKTGAGTLTLSGNNTFTGDLNIGAGTVSVGAANNLGAGTVTISNNGALSTSAGFTAGRAITMGTGGGTINVSANGFTNTAGLNGSGALLKTGAGTLVLSGTAGTYNGTATIGGGTLVANTALSSAAVVISNTGTLMGSSTLGAVTVKSGGVISPGNSPGNLSVSALTLEGGGSYLWEITDATAAAGTGWDVITVGGGAGTITLSANSESLFTINVVGSSPSNFSAGTSRTWDIIDAGSWSSAFSTNAFTINTNNFSATGTLGTWSVQDSSGNLRLVYTAAVSDYNVTVNSGSADQGAAAGGTNLFTGSVGVNKLGAGTLVMTNPLNDYTGVTTIKAGTVSITADAPTNSAGSLGNNTNAVVVGDTTAAADAGFNFGAAVTNAHGLNVVAGTGSAGRTIGTAIGSGTAVQAGAVTLSTNATFTAASGGTLSVSGAITGAGSATISGAGGTVDFTGNNTGYSGTTTLSSGTLRVGNNNALGTAGLTLNGGRLASASGTGYTLTNAITVAGDVGFGQASGGTGALTLSGALGLGASTRSFDVSNSTTLSGIISGSAGAGLTKTGNGTLTISGTNTYAGTTTVNAGTLAISGGSAISDSGAVSLSNNAGATLAVNASETIGSLSGGGATGGNVSIASGQSLTVTEAGTNTFSGAITNAGGLTKAGAGTLFLGGANTYTGQLTINAGSIMLTNAGTIGGTNAVRIGSSGSLKLNNINAEVASVAEVGNGNGGTIDLGSGTLTVSGNAYSVFQNSISGTGGLTKSGTGTLNLYGTQSFSGPVSVSGGELNSSVALTAATNFTVSGGLLGSTAANVFADTANFTLTGTGTLRVGGSDTVGTISGTSGTAVTVTNGTLTTTYASGSNTLASTISGAGGFAKAGNGTLSLTGTATNIGSLAVTGGRLQVGDGGTTGTIGNVNVTVSSGADFAFNRSDNLSYGGVISGSSGALVQLGAGTVTLTGANTYTGATTISNGSLALSGSGTLSSSSTLNIAASGANFSISGISGSGVTVASLTAAANSSVSLGGKALTFGANNANSTFAGEMSGTSGSFIKTGTGTVTLSGSNSMTGTSQLNDGTILIGNNFALGTNSFQIQFDVGTTRTLASDGATARTLQITNLNVFNDLNLGVASTGTGALTFNGRVYLGDESGSNRVITTAAGTMHTFAGPVTGLRGIVKQGDGTLVLSGTNTSTGGLYIDAGAIDLAGGSLSNSVIEIGGGVNGGAQPGNNAALRVSATSGTFTNNITVNSETNSSGARGTRTIEFANASGSPMLSGNVSLETGATVNVTSAGGTGILGGTISGTGLLTKSGSGTLTLTGANTYTGNTLISAGTLQIGNGGTAGSVANNITNNAALIFNRSDNSTSANLISGTGSVTKTGAGTLTLSGANTFAGTLTIGQGGLSAGANSNLGGGTAMTISNAAKLITTASFTSARSLTVGDGGAEINVGSGTVFSNTGAVSGSTALAKTGAGTLSLSNASSSYNGTVGVTAGTLQVNGTASSMDVNVTNSGSVLMGAGSIGDVTVYSGAFIAPGNSVGNLSVSSLNLEAGGGYNWEITAANGTTPGTDWDLITVGGGTGTVAVNSTSGTPFTIYMQGNPTGWDVTNSYSWTIIDAGTLTGFDNSKFAVNFSGFGGTAPTGVFSFSNVSGNLVMAYTAPDLTYNVTVNSGAEDQSVAAGGTNLFTGASALNKLGAGTLIMTNPLNDYTGVTTVKEGTLQINVNAPNNAAGALGTAATAVLVGESTNAVAAGFNIGVAGVTNGRGLSIVAGTGAADRIIGTTITSGVAEQLGTVVLNTNAVFNAAGGGTLLVSGVVSGSGNVTVSNSGTSIFSGVNTYSGTTTILTNATLVAANNSALGATNGATTINSGGTLALSNNISTAENITIAGTGAGGNGALRNISGANTNTGAITLSANATIKAESGTRLSVNNVDISGAANRSVTFDGAGTNLVTGSITTAGGSLSNRIVKAGSGDLVISNNGTTGSGQVRVAEGSVIIAAGSLTTSTNTATRAIDIGLSGDASGTNTAANATFLARSGVTVSNSIYIAPSGGDGSFTRTIGTDSTSGNVTFGNQMYLGGNVQIASAGTANVTHSGNITNDGTASVTKIGDGTLALTANNTWRGSFIAGAGTTILTNGNAVWDTNAVTISNGATVVLGSSETIGSLAGAGTMTLGANSLVTGSNSASTTFSGVIQGAGGIFKNGTGTFTLAGANTFSGDTIVNAGTLAFSNGTVGSTFIRLGPDGSSGNSTVLLSDSDGGTTITAGLVVQSGGGTRSLVSSNSAGTNTYTGSVFLDGNVTIGQQGSGAFDLTGSVVDIKSQSLTLDAAANGSVNISSVLTNSSGTGNLVKTGTGTATLTGANTYSGSTLISTGALQVGNGGATGQLGAGNVTNNASLVVNRTGAITIGNTVSGTGSLTKLGSGTLILTASNSFQGGSTLSAGVIRAANANALGTGSLSASADTVLQVTNSINIANNLSVYSVRFLNGGNTLSGTITNNNTVYDVISGQTNTISGFMTGSGGVELIGGGTLNITGTTNNYTGNTVISNGTLQISTLANSNTVSSIGVSNNVTLAGTNASNAVIDYTGGNVTTDRAFVFNGVATNGEGGTLNISNSSTVVTMTGSASGTGKMIVDGGTLVLSNTSTSDSFAPTSIQVESGATLQLAANNQIGNTTGLILNGGTFLVGGANVIESLGTLTLTTDSTIDFGNFGQTGFRQLTFANSNSDTTGITWVGTLTITNWQGVALTTSDFTEIVFGVGGLTSTQLGQIRFANQDINGGTLIGGGELVPVPEPRVYAAAIALLATIGWRERKRLVGLVRRKR